MDSKKQQYLIILSLLMITTQLLSAVILTPVAVAAFHENVVVNHVALEGSSGAGTGTGSGAGHSEHLNPDELAQSPNLDEIYGDSLEVLTNSGLTLYNENVHKQEPAQYPDKIYSEVDPILHLHKLKGENNTIDEEILKKGMEHDEKYSGPILDDFVTGKLSATENGNTLPIFLSEPESFFVMKNRPAILKCKAAHALKLHFKCSGSSQPPPSVHDKHVDPHTGVHLEEVTATIHRDLIDEYFGKGPFKCECQAWSSRGVVRSQSATISIAYIRKQFTTSPTSLRIEVGSRAELYCEPPKGFPEPKLYWYKNNVPLTESSDQSYAISTAGTLTFHRVSLQDMANYTCCAENVAGRRFSDSAVLIVYVNGGWSSWSSWKECKCVGKMTQGRKRMRSCTNPFPLNGGSHCLGAQVQKSPDCTACTEDTQSVLADVIDNHGKRGMLGRWSPWSEWSACSTDCIQVRRRKCMPSSFEDNESVISSSADVNANLQNYMGSGKLTCVGKDIQTAECRGDQCALNKDDIDWTLYLSIAIIAVVCFGVSATIICCVRRGIWANPHLNIARSDTEYMQSVYKKEMRMHIEAINASYDYPNADNRYADNNAMVGLTMSEHHYDVPNLNSNYTNPIDDLSVDYLSDTPDTSTVGTSNSNCDITAKMTSMSISKNSVCEPINSNGGSLYLYNREIMIYIPELAIGKNQKKLVSLMVFNDDNNHICLHTAKNPLFACSSIVHFEPRNYNFLQPVILKIPHCLVSPDLWNVNIYHADCQHDDVTGVWRKITAVGEETINTPVFVQVDPANVYIMTEQLGRFVVVAEPKPSISNEHMSIKMKLFAFIQIMPSNLNCILRIYVVKDLPNSRDCSANIESQLGGTFVGESKVFAFQLNSCNLKIRVRDNQLAACDETEELPEHLIPYNHILNNNTILHCEFSIKRSFNFNEISLNIDFVQCHTDSDEFQEFHTFTISKENFYSSELICDRKATVSIDREGSFIHDTNPLISQLPRNTKRMICAALDPPRTDEKDWRLLARKLKTDRYIAYFATKPSPTEQILNLWECRSFSSSGGALELLMILQEMERQDVMEIISETTGPLWI